MRQLVCSGFIQLLLQLPVCQSLRGRMSHSAAVFWHHHQESMTSEPVNWRSSLQPLRLFRIGVFFFVVCVRSMFSCRFTMSGLNRGFVFFAALISYTFLWSTEAQTTTPSPASKFLMLLCFVQSRVKSGGCHMTSIYKGFNLSEKQR